MAGKKRILLVEDNPDDEELTRIAFEENCMLDELVVARDGEEALNYLLNPANPLPQLVLLDLNLPKVDGLEVLKRLRANARTRLMPVAVMTSSKRHGDLDSCYSLGCNSYIQKPVDFTQFVDAVSQLGRYWLMLNQPAPLPGER